MLSSRRLSAPAVPRRASVALPRPAVTCRRVRAVLAHGAPHGHGAPTATKTGEKQEKEKGFINEMRMVAMKLHTKDQAPKEGGKEAPKQQGPWAPTREGYLRFLAESQVVYDALEQAMSSKSHPEYAQLQRTGLERAAALAKDIAWFKSEYGLSPPALAADGPGHRYAKLVSDLAESDPPAFICHFYNFYFAHTAGGRMIGNKVSSMVLGGHVLAFYQWEGDVNTLLDNVRRTINMLAESWTPEQKAHCLAETESSFKYSGEILRCITAA